METTLSSKGQIVLPREIRQKLGLRAGTKFSPRIVNGSVVLTPKTPPVGKPRLIRDSTTGLTVTKAPENGVTITSQAVRAILADFP
ncbi:MAG: AbrB/MazE/SpoVT family DNA-binding domain-containing protein [Opitutus sp.]